MYSTMKYLKFVLVWTLLGSWTIAVGQSKDQASPDAGLASFGWLVDLTGGCWRAEFSNGQTRDRQCFRQEFGRVLREDQTVTSLKEGRVTEVMEATSVYAWDGRKQKIRHVFWSSNGGFESSTGWREGDAVIFYLDRETDSSGEANARTVLRKTGVDGYSASREQRKGDKWAPLFSIAYQREAPGK